jgi:quinol monooxygenase YgiN
MMTRNATRVIATFHAKPGREEELTKILTDLIEPTRAETGCHMYELWRNRADPAELTFVEEWDSSEQLAAHAKSEHIREAQARYPQLIACDVDLRLYDLVR